MSWNNFDYKDFACRCGCSQNKMEEKFIDELQRIRSICGFAFIVSSGWRCENHPIEASKLAPGPHQTGLAADIVLSHDRALQMVEHAMADGYFTGFGISQRGDVDSRFIHLDAAPATPNRPRPHIWSY